MVVIELLHPQKEQVLKTWEFDRARTAISIGRSEDNTVALPINLVSRRHIELTKVGGDWKIANLGKNGCYVNGQKVGAALLRSAGGGVFHVQLGKAGPCLRIKLGNPLLQETPVVPPADDGKIYVSRSIREYAARRSLTLTSERTLTRTTESSIPEAAMSGQKEVG